MMTERMIQVNYRTAPLGSIEKCENCAFSKPFRYRNWCDQIVNEVPKNRVCDCFLAQGKGGKNKMSGENFIDARK
jgi:hypothetical protein